MALLLLGFSLVACSPGGQTTAIVSDVWGRPSPASATNAAFYMNIRNNGTLDDTLTSADAGICDSTELHESEIDDAGVMSMEQVRNIDIPSGESVSLEPGGLHVMCIGLASQLEAGQMVPIELSVRRSGTLHVQAEIKEE
jgi:hypothetical protein